MKSKMLNEIHSLVNNCLNLPVLDTDEPRSYSELRELATQKELSDNLTRLTNLLDSTDDEESFKEQFGSLCKERNNENEETCLSYFALPDGDCNKLYWDIAKLVFKPTDFYELLEHLMPNIKKGMILNYYVSEPNSSHLLSLKERARVQVELHNLFDIKVSQDLTELEPNLLNRFVTSNNVIIDLDQLKQLPLNLHTQLYKELKKYPALRNKIYQHNSELKQLLSHMEFLKVGGQSPRQAIVSLINVLEMAGSRYTMQRFASDSARQSLEEFYIYINSLPSEFKASALGLCGNSKQTLSDILNRLKVGDCVETAAASLKAIVDKSTNSDVLDSIPFVAKEQLNEINKKYHKHTLSVTGNDSTTAIPQELRDTLLKNLQLNNANDCIDLLISIPPDEYGTFLTTAKITNFPSLAKDLAAYFRNGMFDARQREAFLEVILSDINKFGVNEAFILAKSMDKFEMFWACVNKLPETPLNNFSLINVNDCVYLLKNIPPNEYGTFLTAAKITDIKYFANDLASYFRNGRFNVQQCEAFLEVILDNINTFGANEAFILAVSMDKLEMFLAYINELPEFPFENSPLANVNDLINLTPKEYGTLLAEKTTNLPALVDRLSDHLSNVTLDPKKCEAFLKPMLADIEKVGAHEALRLANRMDKFEMFLEALNKLPEKDRLSIITKKNNNGDSIWDKTSDTNNKVAFLKAMPEKNRLEAVLKKKQNGGTILDDIWPRSRSIWYPENKGSKFNTYTTILEALPKNDRLPAFKNANPLSRFLDNSNIEMIVKTLCLLPEENRLTALMGEKNAYMSLSNRLATYHWKKMMEITNVLSDSDRTHENERLAVVKSNLNNLLVSDNIKMVVITLNNLPEKKRFDELMKAEIEYVQLFDDLKTVVPFEEIMSIINVLAKSDRLSAITKKNKNGNTVLHLAALSGKGEFIAEALNALPEKERLLALNEKDHRGRTVLQCTVFNNNHETAIATLTLLNAENVRQAILEKTPETVQLLSDVAHYVLNYKSPEAIFADDIKEQCKKLDKKHPWFGLFLLQETLSLDDRYAKFAKENKSVQENVTKIIHTLVHPRGTRFFSGHVKREHLGKARKLLEALKQNKDMNNDELGKLLVKTYHGVLSKQKGPTKPADTSFERRLAYCYKLVIDADAKSLGHANKEVHTLRNRT